MCQYKFGSAENKTRPCRLAFASTEPPTEETTPSKTIFLLSPLSTPARLVTGAPPAAPESAHKMLCRRSEIRQGVDGRQDVDSKLNATFFTILFIQLYEITRQKNVRKITCQLE
ncbi:MAG: hypothetical protein RLZZ33_833 [Pseudomonadota bacterium]